MDYHSYRKKYYIQPPPQPRYDLLGFFQVALYFQDYQAALAYYTAVLGPPAYTEGETTHGWRIGDGWLTLFPAQSGDPQNVELTIHASYPEEAERLQRAFIDAGGEGECPSDQLMYQPLRYCPVKDPFGTEILIVSPLNTSDKKMQP